VQVRRAATAACFVVVIVAGCTSDNDGGQASDDIPVTFEANGGTEQIWLLDDPDVEVALYDAQGDLVQTEIVDAKAQIESVDTRTTDERGALVMRYVPPGEGYVVRRTDGSGQSAPVTVTAFDEHPDADQYAKQEINDGYGYLTTRDGTKLAINVTMPGPAEDGPYPTVIEYSGYDPGSPTPSLVTISKTLAAQFGFATVGVNIRGSGCSGGSMQLWEDAQAIDGYDVVETIAAQRWVQDNAVGMVGISYPATAMMYTAATKPPSLRAIAPMASYDDGFRALLWPGGIQNKGFAREWVEGRYREAQNPNPSDWVNTRIDEGDEVCEQNLEMRGQNVDLAAMIDEMPFFPTTKDLGPRFAPITFADEIEVPTYMVASWQDEQVGGHAPTMIPDLSGVEDGYFALVNGYHAEGLAEPSIFQGWLEFLQLYVAEEVPDTTGLAGLTAVVVGQIIGDVEAGQEIPVLDENFTGMTYDEALAAFRDRPRVRILLESGGNPTVSPGVPLAGFEITADTFPGDDVVPTTWYLGADGTLTTGAPTEDDDADGTIDAYTSDPSNRPEVNLVKGQDPWWKLPQYDWQQPVEGTALSYLSPALDTDTVMAGAGSANLWIRSSEADTDLQVTITEVRSDGQETYVQTGWLRASKRALDEERSTELQPLLSQLRDEAEPMPEGEFVPVRVEIYPFAHAFRAGSQVRIIISAPGADRPVWSFVTLDGTQDNEIARSEGRPSAVVLPVVDGAEIPTKLPACPALRGQPCRPFTSGGFQPKG